MVKTTEADGCALLEAHLGDLPRASARVCGCLGGAGEQMRVASKAARFYERAAVTPRLVTLVLGACWSSGLRLVKALCPVLSQILTFRWSNTHG